MILMIKYKTKKDAVDPHSYFTRTLFAEHPNDPTHEMIRNLVDHVSGGDFDDRSIEIKKRLEFNAKEIKRQGIKVHKLS